ncbi:hypothetical protein DFH08DRAFT_940036 [Mycena albidolilacea]|uniref:Uncharacterized protein n=1 Tax=Mycena albidolilacea TaxID=1033008 RepID=A0AAD7EJP6_9AGAR|nr:hypothetical protein DFH08DRAFT_940036 [Mycena albidolilacea]
MYLVHALRLLITMTRTLHKIYMFIDGQQEGSRIQKFIRQGEMNSLLKTCHTGLQEAFDVFKIESGDIVTNIRELLQHAPKKHQEVLSLIESLSDATGSDRASSINLAFSSAGTSCDTAGTEMDLAAVIGPHLGMKRGKGLTRAVVQHFASSPQSLLILDNFESLWEPIETRRDIEDFLSLLTDVEQLALVVGTLFVLSAFLKAFQITMRGAERPAKVQWSRPFLPPLRPLAQEAARKTFVDVADDFHDSILSRWEKEGTSIISDGLDRRSNLDLSISHSLSSPRMTALPDAQELLNLLSTLPDGLSDVELLRSKLLPGDLFGCKAALLRTSLAYNDDRKRIKVLVPIREYMQKFHPPSAHITSPLLKYFEQLLQADEIHFGTVSNSMTIPRIISNYANIQSMLRIGLHRNNPELVNLIYQTLIFNSFSIRNGRGRITVMEKIPDLLHKARDRTLEVSYITSILNAWAQHPIINPEALISKAMENLRDFENPDIKCAFHFAVSKYYQAHDDIPAAEKFHGMALSLAISTGNAKIQAQLLTGLATMKMNRGEYPAALRDVYSSQTLAKISGNFFVEAHALLIEGATWNSLGNYKNCVSLYKQAQNLLALCGMSGSQMDLWVRSDLAEAHRLKSEYVEAQYIRSQILDACGIQDQYLRAWTLMCIATIGAAIDVPEHDLRMNIELAKSTFRDFDCSEIYCDIILADLELREGNLGLAKSYLQKCLYPSLGNVAEYTAWCLERLGNGNSWRTTDWDSSWTTVFLVHSLKLKRRLGIHKALQYLGDVFLSHGDEHTACTLLIVALDGFTQMDVHRSRGECMLQLGDIAKGHENWQNAVDLWRTARPLFERSSQAKQIAQIDQRIANIGQDVPQSGTSACGGQSSKVHLCLDDERDVFHQSV